MQEDSLENLAALERGTWTEALFARKVIQIAQQLGWMIAHFRPGKTGRVDAQGKPVWVTPLQGDACGWPDVVLFKGSRKLAWELKVGRNKESPKQKHWLDVLEKAGFEVAVCYPKHWETMCKILEGK